MAKGFSIKNLVISRAEREILHDVSLELLPGSITLLLGENGSGKSTLAGAILGNPLCKVTSGSLDFNGDEITALPTFERARRGIFLAHQEPPAIPGVSVLDILRAAEEARLGTVFSLPVFYDRLRSVKEQLGIDDIFLKKELNAQFSGGEKKRIELLSLLFLEPKIAVLDEIDAGMDEGARALLLKVIKALQEAGTAFLIISHHPDIFQNLASLSQVLLKDGQARAM